MPSRADATSPTPITLHILTRLALLVEFLDENHRREEGLYRREGPRMETQDLLEFCLTRDLPDLAVFNPHSIATVIKHVRRSELIYLSLLIVLLLDTIVRVITYDDTNSVCLKGLSHWFRTQSAHKCWRHVTTLSRPHKES
jgi:hypothetical protein